MKTIVSQLIAATGEPVARRNIRALLKVVAALVFVVTVFSVVFHVIMLQEGRAYSWTTGVYWTLTVMSTLGFGDITFESDLGRAFSVVVLLTGIVMLLIVLPFAFIRFFYAPWLEAQVRLRVPRQAPADVAGHVILCAYEVVAAGFVERLTHLNVPYFVVESDATIAANLHGDGISVINRELDSRDTYAAVRAEHARMVVVNRDDPTNSSITLTVREESGAVPIVAFVENNDSTDVLELSGANAVLNLKKQLGNHLAGRAFFGSRRPHVVGRYQDLLIAEFPLHGTGLTGRTLRDTRLRELTGLNVVAVWERGKVLPARSDTMLGDNAVIVMVGTEEQLTELEAMFVIYDTNENAVVLIGGGKVGYAAARALVARGAMVHLVEKDPVAASHFDGIATRIVVGDAADRRVMTQVGLAQAPSVVLTTNDDAINIFLAVYCRKLNPDLRIVSRITHERNIEAIHRAGADFVLSYTTLGVQSLIAMLQQHEIVMLGEGAELFVIQTPMSLEGRTLAESGIGARTGLNVIAIETESETVTNPTAKRRLTAGSEIVAIGTTDQRAEFSRTFDK